MTTSSGAGQALEVSDVSETETYTKDYHHVECPLCHAHNDLSEAIGNNGESLCYYECGNCDHKFSVRVHISISVTADVWP